MIQIINYEGKSGNKEEYNIHIKYSKISSPQSLDEFETNIIDLCNPKIWTYAQDNITAINCINDFRSLNVMLQNSKKSTTLIMLPQDYSLSYDYFQNSYLKCIKLKDMLTSFQSILSVIHSAFNSVEIIYENTKTKIGQNVINSAFYFNIDTALTYSIGSCKTTTFKYKQNNNIIITSLNLDSYCLWYDKNTELGIQKIHSKDA